MTGPLKWPGGKHYLAKPICALMPRHTHYVEPFADGLAVLLAKPYEGTSEVVNDLNQDLTNFWRVLQSKKLFREFARQAQAIPFSGTEWQDAKDVLAGPAKSPSQSEQIERAVKLFIYCRQSMAGRCQQFAPLTRNRTRRNMNEQAAAWLNAVDGLPAVHDRLKRVVILNRPAIEVLKSQDGPETLFYLDPPYVHETRASDSSFGEFEMTDAQHEELLACIAGLQGHVMLSGYSCPMYEDRLKKWHRHEFDRPNDAAGGVIKRRMTEVIWCNFKPPKHKEVAA